MDVSKVTTGKPKIGGAVYSAPIGTTLPTDAVASLAAAFVEMGYCSDDGLTNSDSRTVNQVKAWGGDTVLTPLSDKSDKLKMKLIEAMNVNVLKAIYGSSNVSGTSLSTGISTTVNATEPEARSWVVDMVLSGGVLKRIVVPNATIGELGDIVYNDTDPVGYDVTLYALPDGDGNTHYEHMISAGSTPAAPTNRVISGYYDDQADKFYYDAAKTNEITNPGTTNVYVDLTTSKLYLWDGETYQEQ